MESLRVLFLGDVVGPSGMDILEEALPHLKKEKEADVLALNGENACNGYGLDPKDLERFFALGVSVVTTGNHVWQRESLKPFLDQEDRLLRPDNYPPGVPGHGSWLGDIKGVPLAFLNLQGRERMGRALDCPFRGGDKALEKLKQNAACVVVDFHAEDTGEKEALAHYLDGRVSAVLGTHTHVQTRDERILPGGTAYITDLGMCGPQGSVIGMNPEDSLQRAVTQLPLRMQVLKAPSVICGVLLTLDPQSGKARGIERIQYPSSAGLG